MRLFLAVALLLWPIAGHAQTAEPRLNVEIEPSSVVVGQMIRLRVTLLVPTWMPKPPVFPNLETPDAIVQLPANSSSPMSTRIEGETWSGIVRNYQIHPLKAGRYRISPQAAQVTYAEPMTRDPVTVEITSPEIVFEAVIPPGAENLDPFLAAETLTLEQEVAGESEGLAPGDAIERVVTARITGAPALLLPPMLSTVEGDGVASYLQDPVVSDKAGRGAPQRGERIERATYVAESGGSFEANAVEISWYNLGTGEIETATLPAITLTVEGPPPAQVEQPFDLRAMVVRILPLLLLALVIVFGLSRLWTPACDWVRRRRALWRASEPYAFRRLLSITRRRDAKRFYATLSLWLDRLSTGITPETLAARTGRPDLLRALEAIGGALYKADSRTPGNIDWQDLTRELRMARSKYRASRGTLKTKALSPLNPRSIS